VTPADATLAAVLWAAVPVLPILLCAALGIRPLAGAAERLAPWAALPALLLLAVTGPDQGAGSHRILLGSWLGLDAVGRTFLFFTATLWTAAGVYAAAYLARDPARRRFFGFHLLALAGNLGLLLAADLVTFYLFFSLMTFAGYGLVVHDGTLAARRAGRTYIALAIVGEALLLAAMVLAFHTTGVLQFVAIPSIGGLPGGDLYIALALAGLGVKAGLVPLHVWLPLAHPVAPTPASAVLSGAMIKAGLIGWIRFLPAGSLALPDWGTACMALGLAAALGAAAAGLAQDRPKTILAYSSISQMGWLTAGLGAALLATDTAAAALAAIAVFAAHHGLAKGALFLGTGLASHATAGRRRAVWTGGLAIGALALAGAPWTSGAVAKALLKEAGYAAGWPGWMTPALTLAATGTALLLARFLVRMLAARPDDGGVGGAALWAPWLGLTAAGIVLPLAWAAGGAVPGSGAGLGFDTIVPIAVAAAIAALALRRPLRIAVPEGDLVVLYEAAATRALRALAAARDGYEGVVARAAATRERTAARLRETTLHDRIEDALEPWLAIGITVLAVGAVLTLLLLVTG
jgi:hydrogenase-4 component B